jgi:hypothetical protein
VSGLSYAGSQREFELQSLAAFTFEADVDDPQKRLAAMDSLIDDWLTRKGAGSPTGADGSFISKTGDGTGQFSRTQLECSVGSLREIERACPEFCV